MILLKNKKLFTLNLIFNTNIIILNINKTFINLISLV